MPDIMTHVFFARDVRAALPEETRALLLPDVADCAAVGPDVWFSWRFWCPWLQGGRPRRGDVMQKTRTGAFLTTLAVEARECPEAEGRAALFSYLAGFLCHYALDAAAHPYIIWRTGDYDGTPATLGRRGDHMRLERALDLRAMQARGLSLGGRPVTRACMPLRRLPRAAAQGLDKAYRQVYGWADAWRELNIGWRDQRRLYRLAQEPTGLMDALARRLDNGKSRSDFTAVCYHGRGQPGVDIANEGHAEWRHPRDASLASRESFDELCARAAAHAREMILAAWRYLADGDERALSQAVGDVSYETGFDCGDERNTAPAACDPLPLKRRGGDNRKG